MTVTATLPKHHKKGISIDGRASQYCCRVGFQLTPDGRRVQAGTKYLSNDPDEATRRHGNLVHEWEKLCANWYKYQQILPPVLPANLRNADLSKPVWVRDEWITAAERYWKKDAEGAMQGVVQELTAAAASHVDAIDTSRAALATMSTETKLIPSQLASTPEAAAVIPSALLTGQLLNALPADVRARVMQALQPAANEVLGVAADAENLTIKQVADKYLEAEKTRVGSQLRGISANSYSHRKNMVDAVLKLLDANADIRTMTHERLMAFVIEAGKKAKSATTAFDWCRHGLLPVLKYAHKNSRINFRLSDDADEIFKLRRPHAEVRTEYTPDTVAKLKAIHASGERLRAESWVFVLLALNTGAYQADIASWTYDNLKIQKDGRVIIEWERMKEKNKGQRLILKHELWAETWARMQQYMAPDDSEKNPERRLFLTRDGKAMWYAQLGKSKVDVIGLRYKRAVAASYVETESKGKKVKLPVSLAFKQFRKIGMNAMNSFGGNSLEIARVYAGHALPNVDAAYLVNRYQDMNEVLAKWRTQLIADGVLEPVKVQAK